MAVNLSLVVGCHCINILQVDKVHLSSTKWVGGMKPK